MSHIGIFSPAAPGHINPMSCLGRALQSRGHRITYFQMRDQEEAIRKTGLDFVAYAERDFPVGSCSRLYAELGKRDGLAAMRYAIDWFTRESLWLFEEGPALIRGHAIDALLIDQATPAAYAVAEYLDVPFVCVSNALILNREPAIPPFFTPWGYSTSAMAALRNRLAYAALDRLSANLVTTINRRRLAWGLAEFRTGGNWATPWAHVAQQPACFDFPRRNLPPNFHYTGPFHDVRVRPPAPFPWERLSGRPLIYASIGTLQNRMAHVFREIAAACRGIDADLVISLGGGAKPEDVGELPGDPIVVGFAPQLELLAKAALTITHAGLNTALETVSAGVPAVAIPVGNDQPGVAARLKWLGVAEAIPVQQLQAGRLRPLVEHVLREPRYRERAKAWQSEIRKLDGIKLAADIAEQVLQRNRPRKVIGDSLR